MGRSPSYEKVGLRKGPWTPDEDQKLMAYIEEHGRGSWRALPAKAGLRRCEKSCRLRWTNYLRPDIKRGNFSLQEDQTIIQLHALLGNKWSAIAAHLPKRTDNEIKNHWNTQLKKRLTKMGIDPMTHKPKTDAPGSGTGSHSGEASNLSHMAQWECARLEAEARIVKESKLQLGSFSSKPVKLLLNKIPPQPSLPPCLDVLKAWQRSFFNSLSPDHTKMHNMYAMMLATDDLESPTSTLSFTESIVLPISTTAGNNFLPAAITAKSSALCEGANAVNIVETSDYESWNLHEETKLSGKGMDHNIVSNLQDDDIMVAVEAFIPAAGYDESAPSLVLSNNIMEAVVNNNMLVYDTSESLPAEEENLRIINGDASNWNVNLLNLVNDLPPGWPVF